MASHKTLNDLEYEYLLYQNLAVRMDYQSGSSPVYIGDAQPGTLESEAYWRIKKITYDSSENLSKIEWAQGNSKFTHSWDNRETITYS